MKQAKVLTEKEFKKVIDMCSLCKHAERNKAILELMYFSGMRVSEISKLRVYDVLNGDGEIVGKVTSGSFSPILNMPISMAYVDIDYAPEGTTLFAMNRRGNRTLQVVPMPWVKKRYKLT